MIKRLSIACLGLLSLPLAAQQSLPPPGGPYPSTVSVEKSSAPAPSEAELRFPPPDLIAPTPPPPSLSEELGADFAQSPSSATGYPPAGASASRSSAYAPAAEQGAARKPPAQPYANSPGGYPSAPSVNPPVSPAQGAYAYPLPARPPATAWRPRSGGSYSGNVYPGNAWSGYPYYGYPSPGYGYAYPGTGYGNSNPAWGGQDLQTPFGTLPSPWDAMPGSFLPGR